VEDVEAELAKAFEAGAGFELGHDGEDVELPHGGGGPEAIEGEIVLAVVGGDGVFGEAEIVFEPLEEGRLEDAAAAVEGVAGEPDEFGTAEAEAADVLELVGELFAGKHVGKAESAAAI